MPSCPRFGSPKGDDRYEASSVKRVTTASGSRSSQARPYASIQSASSMRLPPIVERDRPCHGDVQRLGAPDEWDGGSRGAGGDHFVGEPLPLRAQDKARVRRV